MVKMSVGFLNKLGFQLESEGVEIDLVCGMEVDLSKAKHKSRYGGKNYYFCSESCKDHFDGNSGKYVGE